MSEQCQNPGAYKYTWPGRNEAYACKVHAAEVRALANMGGLYIQIRPIPEDEQWQCEQRYDPSDAGEGEFCNRCVNKERKAR